MLKLSYSVRRAILLSCLGGILVCSIFAYAWSVKADDRQPNFIERFLRRFQKPSEIGKPPGTHQAGANRGECPQTHAPLTAFVTQGNSGSTYAEHPAIWFYVPFTSQMLLNSTQSEQPIKFVLVEAAESESEPVVYKASFPLPATEGMLDIKLPDSAPVLEFDKQYRWSLSIYCRDDNPSGAATVNGWIERLEVKTTWYEQLQAATTIEEQLRLYSEKGLWYDMVDVLIQQHKINPNDPSIAAAWDYLLGFVNLCSLFKSPSDYCPIEDAAPQ